MELQVPPNYIKTITGLAYTMIEHNETGEVIGELHGYDPCLIKKSEGVRLNWAVLKPELTERLKKAMEYQMISLVNGD